MKKAVKCFGVILLILVLFRGFIFRCLIGYKEIGTRPLVELIDKRLIEAIEAESGNSPLDISEVIDIANSVTSQGLSFTFNKATSNPNELVNTKRANCIGYSAMFNAVANYLIDKNQLQADLKVEHKIGRIEFLGHDIHQYFDNSFFKNHDFNMVTDLKNGIKISIDPTLCDYLWIRAVTRND